MDKKPKTSSGVNPKGSPERTDEHPPSITGDGDDEHRPTDAKPVSETKAVDSSKDHVDLTIEEELFQAADNQIVLLNKQGVALGRTDINEPERQHIPNLVNMEEYEDWAKEAEPYAIDKKFKKRENEFVGKKIDPQEILKDVTTQDGQVKKCRHVMILGSAGTGKTTFLRRLALIGKHGLLKGKLPIMLDLRPIPTKENLTPSRALLGRLFSDWDSERMKQRYQWIKENSEKIAFIIDSLDTLPFEFQNERQRIGYKTLTTVDVILHNLMSRDLFPKSVIISSSREYKVRNLHPSVRPDRCVLLDGLKKESVNDLIDGFLGKDKGVEVKRHIDLECPDLWPLLSIPVFLVFTSIGFQQDGFRPETMSGILVKFFLVLIGSKHVHVKDALQALKKLMPMSYEGVCRERVLFTREDLKRFNITPEQATDLGVLIPQTQGTFFASKLIQDDRFFLYFNHQTEQECLAALHILSMNGENFTAFVKRDLYKTKFTVVRRIICGILLNRKVLEATTKLTEISAVDEKKHTLLKSLENALKERQKLHNQESLFELFIDLNESKSGVAELCRTLVKEVNLDNVGLSPSDVQAVASVMKHCDHLVYFSLANCAINAGKMTIIARTLLETNLKIDALSIASNDLGEEGMFKLFQILQHCEVGTLIANQCSLCLEYLKQLCSSARGMKLKELDIDDNDKIGSEGMFHVGSLVNNWNIEDLKVGWCNLKAEHLEKFSEGAGSAKLGKLRVYHSQHLGPNGMFLLGKLVKYREVKDLDAGSCNMTSECVQKFMEGLEDAKVDMLNLGTTSKGQIYTHSLLDLLPQVVKELDLVGWQISESQQQELQDKLNDIRSPSLKIRLSKVKVPMFLEAEFSVDEFSFKELFGEEESAVEATINAVMNDLLNRVEELHNQLIVGFTGTELDPVKEYVKHMNKFFEQLCKEKVTKTQNLTPNEGSIELHGCGIRFPTGAVNKNTDVQVWLDNNTDDLPDDVTAISPSIRCKPSKFNVPVIVRLTTWFKARNGEKIKVLILSKSNSQTDWKTIHETLLTDTNVIEYEVSHFCEHAAVILNQDNQDVEYILRNDVWMHVQSAMIVSFFCKCQQEMEEIHTELIQLHKRIMSVCREFVVSLGDIIEPEIKSNNSQVMTFKNHDEQGIVKLKITRKSLLTTRRQLYFEPLPHPKKLEPAQRGELKVSYKVKLLNSKLEPIEGGFTDPLHFGWTMPVEPQERANEENVVRRRGHGESSSLKPDDLSAEEPGVNVYAQRSTVAGRDIIIGDANNNIWTVTAILIFTFLVIVIFLIYNLVMNDKIQISKF